MAHQKFSYTVLQKLAARWTYFELFWQLTKREVIGRYRGSVLGLLWSFFNPLFMLTVYTFFFSTIYQSRWGESTSKLDFAIALFTGLIPFTLFSDCVNRAPHLIISNTNYVKKVIFPLEILPLVSLGAALFHSVISVLVLLLFFLGIHHYLPWTIIFIPLVNLPLIFLLLGFSWFLAAMGVFLRDLAHTMSMFTTALLFLSPIFYPTALIPEPYRRFIAYNPLTPIIEQNRAILVSRNLPNWSSLALSMAVGVTIACLGYYLFRKTKYLFADVI